jgi:hypothetical protein
MCEWRSWEERYWTVCWKWRFIPYPCRKIRSVRRWCCEFEWIKETRYGLYCSLEGCSGGRRYTWGAFCFGLFGTAYFHRITKCFNRELSPAGSCGSL